MGEIEAQLGRCDEGTFLRDVRTKRGTKGVVEQMRDGVIGANR